MYNSHNYRQKPLCIYLVNLTKYNLLLSIASNTPYFHPRYCCDDNSDQCGCYSDPYCGHFTVCYCVGNSDYVCLVQDTSQKHQETGEYIRHCQCLRHAFNPHTVVPKISSGTGA